MQLLLDLLTRFILGRPTGIRTVNLWISKQQPCILPLSYLVSALYSVLNIPVILQLFDISKYFDKEILKDAMDTLLSCPGEAVQALV